MSKQLGILFKPEMVLAILEGRKTQTRRGLPEEAMFVASSYIEQGCEQVSGRDENGNALISFNTPSGQSHVLFSKWAKGDYLYVKETWWSYGYFEETMEATKSGKQKKRWVQVHSRIEFAADHDDDYIPAFKASNGKNVKWRKMSSLFLAQKDARIWLKVTNVRVERLLDITIEDAKAEGITEYGEGFGKEGENEWRNNTSVENYFWLWDSINGAGSHKENCWVWVIEFERCEKP